MKNLKLREEDPVAIYNDIVSHKKLSTQEKLKSLEEIVIKEYDNYSLNYNNNTLERIAPLNITDELKEELRKLYTPNLHIVCQIRSLTKYHDGIEIAGTCPYCTISESSSVDHYLPKGEYFQFSVYLNNLFPCCHQCNGYKKGQWLEDGGRLFLNLYLDTLPNKQYLFVNLDDSFVPSFFIENRNNIESELFNIIESHYSKLKLPSRFRTGSSKITTELIHTIKSFKNLLPIVEIQESLLARIEEERKVYGYNHWKSILQITLLENQDFLNSIN